MEIPHFFACELGVTSLEAISRILVLSSSCVERTPETLPKEGSAKPTKNLDPLNKKSVS